jgi:hypothetical protein
MAGRYLGIMLICAGIACGCGSSQPQNVGKVSGKVTLEGQPLAGAVVTFSPVTAGGSSALGRTDDSGQFSLSYAQGIEGAEIGENRVSISTYDEGDPDGDPPRPKVLEKVPLKYNVRTELVRDVKPEDNTFDFELHSDGPVIADPGAIPDQPTSSDGCR